MSTFTITGTVTNEAGASAPIAGSFSTTSLAPVVDSVVVTPDPAPAGTLRTITINAHDPNTPPLGLTYNCLVNGAAATPVAGAPNKFTYQA